MQNNRLIEMNQYGDFLYIGQYKRGTYRNWGDYAVDLLPQAIEQIMRKLYYFEESFEDLIDRINLVGNINPISQDELKKVMGDK